jgi:hypothetical protein
MTDLAFLDHDDLPNIAEATIARLRPIRAQDWAVGVSDGV